MKVDHCEVSAYPEQSRQKESLLEIRYPIVDLLLPDALIELQIGYFIRYIVHAILPASLVWERRLKRGINLVHESCTLLRSHVLSISTCRVKLDKVVIEDGGHDITSSLEPIGLI